MQAITNPEFQDNCSQRRAPPALCPSCLFRAKAAQAPLSGAKERRRRLAAPTGRRHAEGAEAKLEERQSRLGAVWRGGQGDGELGAVQDADMTHIASAQLCNLRWRKPTEAFFSG